MCMHTCVMRQHFNPQKDPLINSFPGEKKVRNVYKLTKLCKRKVNNPTEHTEGLHHSWSKHDQCKVNGTGYGGTFLQNIAANQYLSTRHSQYQYLTQKTPECKESNCQVLVTVFFNFTCNRDFSWDLSILVDLRQARNIFVVAAFSDSLPDGKIYFPFEFRSM